MRIVVVGMLIAGLVLGLVGCSSPERPSLDETPPAGDPASGTTPAPPSGSTPGITQLEGDRITAEGWLAYIDLEGGFYAIQDGPPSDTPEVTVDVATVIVIANSVDFSAELEQLTGSYVIATGTLLDGVSIRMAGPEMMLESIELAR